MKETSPDDSEFDELEKYLQDLSRDEKNIAKSFPMICDPRVDYDDDIETTTGFNSTSINKNAYKEEHDTKELDCIMKSFEIDASERAARRIKKIQDADECLVAGLALQLKFKPHDAMQLYNKGISICPDHAKLYMNRSILNMECKKPDKSIKDALKCIEINPNLSQPYFIIASNYSANFEFEKSLDILKKGKPLFPELSSKFNTDIVHLEILYLSETLSNDACENKNNNAMISQLKGLIRSVDKVTFSHGIQAMNSELLNVIRYMKSPADQDTLFLKKILFKKLFGYRFINSNDICKSVLVNINAKASKETDYCWILIMNIIIHTAKEMDGHILFILQNSIIMNSCENVIQNKRNLHEYPTNMIELVLKFYGMVSFLDHINTFHPLKFAANPKMIFDKIVEHVKINKNKKLSCNLLTDLLSSDRLFDLLCSENFSESIVNGIIDFLDYDVDFEFIICCMLYLIRQPQMCNMLAETIKLWTTFAEKIDEQKPYEPLSNLMVQLLDSGHTRIEVEDTMIICKLVVNILNNLMKSQIKTRCYDSEESDVEVNNESENITDEVNVSEKEHSGNESQQNEDQQNEDQHSDQVMTKTINYIVRIEERENEEIVFDPLGPSSKHLSPMISNNVMILAKLLRKFEFSDFIMDIFSTVSGILKVYSKYEDVEHVCLQFFAIFSSKFRQYIHLFFINDVVGHLVNVILNKSSDELMGHAAGILAYLVVSHHQVGQNLQNQHVAKKLIHACECSPVKRTREKCALLLSKLVISDETIDKAFGPTSTKFREILRHIGAFKVLASTANDITN